MIELLLLKLGVPQIFVKLVITLAIIAVCIAGYYYVTHLQNKLDKTEKSLEIVSKNLEDYKLNAEQILKGLTVTAEDITRIQSEMDKTNEVYRKHDFQKLFEAKPGLVLNRINSGTQRVFRELESESGKSVVSTTADDQQD